MHTLPFKTPAKPDSLSSFLEISDAGKIIAHAKRLALLSRIYQEIVPAQLGLISQLVNYKSEKLILHTSSHAAASKLRQMAPTLVDGFSRRGYQCNDIQIKVQPIETKKDSPLPAREPLSLETLKEIEELQKSLPESALRAALGKLVSHARDQGSGDREGSGGFAAEVTKPHPLRIGWGERSDAQHLACAKRKPFQVSGIRRQESDRSAAASPPE
ncbi:MAG: DciA family protein [Candidatus Accumulibacter sp.]|jgi:hypothetical protein|nr:DciA family protein [Accumulibacter sp.]